MKPKYNPLFSLSKFICNAAFVVIPTITVVLFLMFSSMLNHSILSRELWQTQRAAASISKIANQEIGRCLSVLDTAALALPLLEEAQSEQIASLLDSVEKRNPGFSDAGVIDLQGNGLAADRSKLKIEDDRLIPTVKAGQHYISNIQRHQDNENFILMVAPIFRGQTVTGAIFVHYDTSHISEIVGDTEESLRYFQIIDDDGSYVTRTDNRYSFSQDLPLWEELERYQLSDGVTIEEIHDNMLNQLPGTFHFSYHEQGRYVSYEPLGINNWYIFSVLVESNINSYTDEIRGYFNSFLFWFIILSLIIITMVFFSDQNKRKIIRQQNEDLMVKNKLFEMILDKTRDIPFEINLPERKLKRFSSSQYGRKHGYEVWEDFSPDAMLRHGEIREDSYEQYQKLYEDIFSGKEIEPVVFQMKMHHEWRWVKINILHATKDALIGFLEDYDTEVKQEEKLHEANQQASEDALTGLYRREAFILKVEQMLEDEDRKGALFLIDLDGFKEVNDLLGHITGDRALHDAALSLRKIVRKSDPVGRLGGDEFMLFLANTSDLLVIDRCAQSINRTLNRTYEENGHSVTVTASVGIALREPGMKFQELYQMADAALYEVKRSSKNNYHIAHTHGTGESRA